jgi:hypothetical protein
MTRKIRLLMLLALPACASSSPPPATAPAPSGSVLAYAVPAAPTVTYAFTDSSGFNIQGGAIGNITATINSSGTADITYAQAADGVEATIKVTDFAGAMTNSAMGGGPSATEADIEGVAVVKLSPRGNVTVVSLPKLAPNIQRVGVSNSFFRRFFARLPGARVQSGAMWVDTINISDENAGTKADVLDIVTSRFVRDTTVDARRLALITLTSARTLNIAGSNEGVEIAQKLTGTSSGRVLWDIERGVMVERTETSELSGTFDLPQMGMSGLPVTARSNSRMSLR